MSFKPTTARDRLILALDVPTVEEAQTIVDETKGAVGTYKIGMQLQFAGGLTFAEELAREGHSIFLDVKLLDIDNTIASAVKNVAKMGMKFMTLHAYPKTMRAAVDALAEVGNKDLCLLGVTVLTSMDERDLGDAGYVGPIADLVEARAKQASATGMGGIVCSPVEAAAMRAAVGDSLAIITPGVRPAGADVGDQKRIMTPGDAVTAGADYLVVGRPILKAADRRAAAQAICREIEAALA
ncbi:orotidine-5'-phosphate decarboxylase [Pseudovibrio sp. SPO723]|uniref:orotidine-5'-phosphate decarboxylase n=1 Tax=Nesiotobacter zosterae TaxID=392721 RepID=UPI0029C13488|nr:orotidine-5'-phosphate decarboxylase [Pseudovibrio sp. SPO723]MDX5592062.1 orotidine-5'-phosphate decarboxylase [Pseudovibrio sp. SPO723]